MKINAGTAYYAEEWSPERIKIDASMMRDAGITLVRLGEFAWTKYEPEEGSFSFGWLHKTIRIMFACGIRTILCTPTSTPPSWLIAKHPEILYRPFDGKLAYPGVPDRVCYTNPVYRKYSEAIVEKLAFEFRNEPGIAFWQIDNEIGNTSFSICHCLECQSAFQRFLREKYGTLSALNCAWGTTMWNETYTSWNEIRLAEYDMKLVIKGMNIASPRVLDSLIFKGKEIENFIANQTDAIRKHLPGAVIGTNNLYQGSCEPYDVFSKLDFAAHDLYPSIHSDMSKLAKELAIYANYKPGVPPWIMETAVAPGAPVKNELRFFLWNFVAHGFDNVVFFHWRSQLAGREKTIPTFLGATGKPRDKYHALKTAIHEIHEVLADVSDLPMPHSPVAVVHDPLNAWIYGLDSETQNLDYANFVESAVKTLQKLSITPEIISPDHDFRPYRLIVFPVLPHVSKRLAKKIRSFVKRGGVVLSCGWTGMMDGNSKLIPEPGPEHLHNVFGISIEDYIEFNSSDAPPKFEPHETFASDAVHFSGKISGKKISGTAARWIADLEMTSAIPLLRYENTVLKGKSFCTENSYGAGFAIYMGSPMPDAWTKLCILHYSLEKASVSELPLPENVQMTIRGNVTFFLNFNNTEISFPFAVKGKCYPKEFFSSGNITLPPREVFIVKAD